MGAREKTKKKTHSPFLQEILPSPSREKHFETSSFVSCLGVTPNRPGSSHLPLRMSPLSATLLQELAKPLAALTPLEARRIVAKMDSFIVSTDEAAGKKRRFEV